MITKIAVALLLGVPAWVLGQLPTVTLPTFFNSGTGSGTVGGVMSSVVGYFNSWDNLFPLDQAGYALGIVASSWAAALIIKVVRIVASFLTAGGGSAA